LQCAEIACGLPAARALETGVLAYICAVIEGDVFVIAAAVEDKAVMRRGRRRVGQVVWVVDVVDRAGEFAGEPSQE